MWGELMNAEGRSSKPPSRGKGIFPRLTVVDLVINSIKVALVL